MKQHGLKRKVALWLAMVMVFGIIMPTAVPITVTASTPPPAVIRLLEAWPSYARPQSARLIGGFGNNPVEFEFEATNPQDILLTFPTEFEFVGEMSVLRYFMINNYGLGNKIELWVERVSDVDNVPTLNVTYNVFERTTQAGINVYTNRTTMGPFAVSALQGGAFQCPVHPNVTLRFMWDTPASLGIPSPFLFFIEGGLALGQVYDFVLERYDSAGGTAYRNNAGGFHQRLANDRGPSAPSYEDDQSDKLMVFPGFRTTDVNVFPYAEAAERAPNVQSGTPTTTPPTYLPHSLPDFNPNALITPSAFLTHPLNMTSPAPPSHVDSPARGDNGLDIRVRLPRFFDEATGRFDMPITAAAASHDLDGEFISWISLGPDSPESFRIEATFSDMVTDNTTIGHTAGAVLSLSTGTPLPRVSDVTSDAAIQLRNATLLTAANGDPVARFMVGGLLPSIVYETVTVTLDMDGESRRALAATRNFAGHYTDNGLNLFTFLDYRFSEPIGGIINAIIMPYRYHWFSVPGRAAISNPRIIGSYRFYDTTVGAGLGTTPIVVNYDGGSTEIRIPVFGSGNRSYRIDFNPGSGGHISSQTVIINPERRPTVGAPNILTITQNEFIPRRMANPLHTGMAADVNYTVRWQVGRQQDLLAMFQRQAPDTGHYEQVTLVYRLFRGLVPASDAMVPFIDIHMHITQTTPGNPASTLEVSYEVHIINSEPGTPPTNRVIPLTSPAALHPVTGGIIMAEIEVDMPVLHNTLQNAGIVPPNFETWQNLLGFPAVHHMNIKPMRQYRNVVAGDGTPITYPPFDEWPSSPFASLTLSDFDRINPPPPGNLTAVTQNNPTSPPALNVSFTVPSQGLQAYMANHYRFDPIVTFNLFVGAFEDAINAVKDTRNTGDTAFPAANTIDFISQAAPGTPLGTFTFDEDQLKALRAGTVLRIEGIPLVNPFNIAAVQQGGWSASAASLAVIASTPPQSVDIAFTILGLDENQRYFLFAETDVERLAVAEALLPGASPPEEPGDHIETNTSVPTALAGDVTIGTPQIPGPGEVVPPSPDWVRHEPPGQTDVLLYWQNIPSEDPAEVTIEYEIIRVSNTVFNINDITDRSMEEIIASRPDAVGWRTNQSNLNPFLQIFLPGQPIGEQALTSASADYSFNPLHREEPPPVWVSFADRTLRPNSLYFYYVRTVRRARFTDPADQSVIILENRSPWVEESVTTSVVQPPQNLREEDGSDRPGFVPETQMLVSWAHPAMDLLTIHRDPNETLVFEYQIREDGEAWGDIIQVPIASLTNPNNLIGGRFHLMLRNLSPGTNYQMRVRLTDRETGDTSVWSNILSFITGWDDERFRLERETDNWLEHLRRLLMEQVRQPFWVASDTPELLRAVYRPDAFRALIDAPGAAIPLYNTNARTSVYYLPVSGILEANDNRKGLSSAYGDMEILFAPRFLNQEHNRAIMDMARNVSSRNVNVNDYFVRVTLERQSVTGQLHGNPPLGDAVDVRIDLVGVNTNVRNIRTWDTNLTNRATQIIDTRAADPVIRQNIFNLVERGDHDAERGEYLMLDYLATVEAAVAAEISRLVLRDIPVVPNNIGIIATQQISVTAFDAPIHIVSTNNAPNLSVNAFTQVRGGLVTEWINLHVIEHANGVAMIAQAPGLYAFSGQAINIPGIEDVPRGDAITSLVARFGLAGLFGQGDINLHRNATRHEIVGSVARLAGAPASANAMTWVSANMNVTLANRNASGFVSQQEAVALVMALYENKTNTRVGSMIIRNHANTAGMTLDTRYAQAVRAAFEIGIVNNEEFQPAAPVTVGDFLNMLAALDGRIGL